MTNLAIVAPKPDMRLVRRSILTMSETDLGRVKLIVDYLGDSQLTIAKNGSNRMSKGDIALVIFKGLEVGLEPMAALESIDLISGKPTLDPAGMLALVQASGQLEDIKFVNETDVMSEIMMKRIGQSEYTRIFTIEDARRMQTTEYVNGVKQTIPLTEKANWKAMPSIMLKCRNISQMCRYLFGDVIQGLYTPEELGATVNADADGHMVVLHTDPPKQQSATPSSTPPQQQLPDGMKGTWATAEKIQQVFDTLAGEKYGIQGTEAIKLAGIDTDKGRDPVEWNKRFETGKAAFEHIKAEFDKALAAEPPAKPKNAELTEEMLIDALEERYPHSLAEIEEQLGHALMDKAMTLKQALDMAAGVITTNVWSVLSGAGTYKAAGGKANQHYTELETGIGAIRVYGRDTFKKMSEVFYDENGVESWKPGARHEFSAPLIVTWEQKAGYRLATEIDIYAPEDWVQEPVSDAEKEFNNIGQ